MTLRNHQLYHLLQGLQAITLRVLRSLVQLEVTGIAQCSAMITALLDPIQELMEFLIRQANTERYTNTCQVLHFLGHCSAILTLSLSFVGQKSELALNSLQCQAG
jgi:hypothetical protein